MLFLLSIFKLKVNIISYPNFNTRPCKDEPSLTWLQLPSLFMNISPGRNSFMRTIHQLFCLWLGATCLVLPSHTGILHKLRTTTVFTISQSIAHPLPSQGHGNLIIQSLMNYSHKLQMIPSVLVTNQRWMTNFQHSIHSQPQANQLRQKPVRLITRWK